MDLEFGDVSKDRFLCSFRVSFFVKYWAKTIDALKISMFISIVNFIVNLLSITCWSICELQNFRQNVQPYKWLPIFFVVSNYLCCTYPIPSNILFNSSLNSCNHFAGHSLWQRTHRNVNCCLWTALGNYSYSPYFDNSFRFFVATFVINLLIVHFHYIVTSIDYSSIISEWCSFKKTLTFLSQNIHHDTKHLDVFTKNINLVWKYFKKWHDLTK